MLRAELIKAQDYAKKQRKDDPEKRPARDLRLESLARVISKETPLLVTANRSQDILAALRVASEFDIKLILDGAAEAYLVAGQIKESGFPVIVHPTMFRSGGANENLSMETAAKLKEAGIRL
jgi:imidazolonepropionase-like amidohydrolase